MQHPKNWNTIEKQKNHTVCEEEEHFCTKDKNVPPPPKWKQKRTPKQKTHKTGEYLQERKKERKKERNKQQHQKCQKAEEEEEETITCHFAQREREREREKERRKQQQQQH